MQINWSVVHLLLLLPHLVMQWRALLYVMHLHCNTRSTCAQCYSYRCIYIASNTDYSAIHIQPQSVSQPDVLYIYSRQNICSPLYRMATSYDLVYKCIIILVCNQFRVHYPTKRGYYQLVVHTMSCIRY